jgi:hypothetical protein
MPLSRRKALLDENEDESTEAPDDNSPLFTAGQLERLFSEQEAQAGRPGPAPLAPTPDALEEFNRIKQDYQIRGEELQAQIAAAERRPATKARLVDDYQEHMKKYSQMVTEFKYNELRRAMSKPVLLSPEAQAAKDQAIKDGTYKPYKAPKPLPDPYAEDAGRDPRSTLAERLRAEEEAASVRDFLGGTS